MVTHRNLALSSERMATAMKRLSSGLRINSAADDAAGLTISQRMRAQVTGLDQANRNIQDGMSLLNTIDGALSEVHSILHRARDLAVQWNNTTNGFDDRAAIRAELISLCNEIARIAQDTTYAGRQILNDSTTPLTLQIGANDGETLSVSLIAAFGSGTELVRPVEFGPLPWLDADIAGFDFMIDHVSGERGRIGAVVARLEHAYASNDIKRENLMQAESRIRDVDIASEMTDFTRQQILQSSGQTMLLFANQSPMRLLDLIPT